MKVPIKKSQILITGILLLNSVLAMGQGPDSVTLAVNTVESKELLDYYRFEEIDYFKTKLIGKNISSQYFILTSNEYWSGELTKTDTIANTRRYQLKNSSDTLEIRVMSKKINRDTIKFQFHLPMYSTSRKFKTTTKNTYSLRAITTQGEENFVASQPIDVLVLSLPYKDPEQPGYLFYCELSREGTPPEKWGEKFGVEHYIVFKLQLID